MQSLDGALPGLAAPGAIGGASGVPGPTDTRARSHHDEADLSADGPRQPATGLIHGRSDEFDEELIPLGDVLVLLAVRGFSSQGHLLLHLASAGVMAAAAWLLRRA